MEVKFNDLTWATERIRREYLAKVREILVKGNFILTDEVNQFEKSWAKIIGVKYCVGTSSGADALYLSLMALGVGRGDEVITQGNAYNATVTAIIRTGAQPRFADVDPDSLRMNVSKIEPLINKKTKVILPVHLYGQVNNMLAIRALAKKHNLAVVEDCAQAHLAKFKDKMAGSWSKAAAFSFYPTKNLGAFGDAGAVVTDDPKVYEKILALRNLGQQGKDNHTHLGFNMRLDVFQAACLNLKLGFLAEATKKRQAAGRYYDRLIKEADIPITPISSDQGSIHVYHLYIVKTLKYDRDKLRQELANLGIQTGVHYPIPVYRQPFYHGPIDPCPVTDQTAKKIISLPMFTDITKREQEYVVEAMRGIIKKSGNGKVF